jgi:hypothetical protein
MIHVNTVTVYARLGQAAIRSGLTLPFRLWAFAHALDAEGKGWVWLEDLHAAWPQSRRTVNRLVKRGLSFFWALDAKSGRLFLRSSLRVALAFGVEPGPAVDLPAETVFGLKTFRAACYSVFFVKPRTISRQKLSGLFGASAPTLRSWEEAEDFTIETNVAAEKVGTAEDALGLPVLPAPDRKGAWYWQGTLFWQLPNTYATPGSYTVRQSRTLNQRVRKQLPQALFNGDRANVRQRLFYDDPEAAWRALNKGKAEVAYVLSGNRLTGGARIWQYCVRC